MWTIFTLWHEHCEHRLFHLIHLEKWKVNKPVYLCNSNRISSNKCIIVDHHLAVIYIQSMQELKKFPLKKICFLENFYLRLPMSNALVFLQWSRLGPYQRMAFNTEASVNLYVVRKSTSNRLLGRLSVV